MRRVHAITYRWARTNRNIKVVVSNLESNAFLFDIDSLLLQIGDSDTQEAECRCPRPGVQAQVLLYCRLSLQLHCAVLSPLQMGEDEEEDECSCRTVWCVLSEGSVPSPHPDAKVVVEAVLDGSPKQLYEVLFADNSHLLEDFLESQGNR